MRHNPMISVQSVTGSFYYFTQVRFGGRYYRAQTHALSGSNR